VITGEWEFAENGHEEKLNKYRRMKDFEKCLEDDEEDVEADKIMSNIRNLESEKFFNIYFNHFDEFDSEVAKEQIKNQMNLDKTIKLSK